MPSRSPDLEQAVRPTGYYRVKAQYLRTLAEWIEPSELEGICRVWRPRTLDALRTEILVLRGVGRETADSILLYAIGKPVFVVDAYTRRITARLGLLPENATYDTTQQYFTLATARRHATVQ